MNLFRAVALSGIFALPFFAQTPPAVVAGSANEQTELNQALAEAGNSPVDVIRALEQHLNRYPESKQRPAITKALTQAAIDANDSRRILLYGEKLLETPPDEIQILDRVLRELARKDDAESSRKALKYSARYHADIAEMRNKPPAQHMTPGQWSEQLYRASARAFALEAHITGNAGHAEQAVELARKSWNAYPTAEGAREVADWLQKTDEKKEAVEFYADAFTLEDPRSTEVDRARDRTRMGTLFTEMNGSEKGLGDVILAAYDRTSALMRQRLSELSSRDPNAQATDIFGFTLPPVGAAAPLALSQMKGKTLVIDVWATWCVPCRAQHPLIENVKARYANSPDVAFIGVNADDDQSLVIPFLNEQKWGGQFWFEGGLQRHLAIAAIPTLLVLDPEGHVSSRMVGLNPERFEVMLTGRIEEARRGSGDRAR